MKTDVSIHFTLRNQSVEDLEKKLTDFINENLETLPFDFSEPTEPRSVLHHCFIPEHLVKEKGFSPDAYEILNQLAETQIYWYGSSNYGNNQGPALSWDRQLMLENLKKLNGLALFIGELTGSVLEEYSIALNLKVDILHIK